MKAFFNLIRWPNLLIIALVQYLIRFFIIESLGIPHVLNHFYFFLGVLCSITLAGAGYIINDIYDVEADRHNKPQRMIIDKYISLNNAWTLYGILNIVAIICGYILANISGMEGLWLLPVVAIALLYLYAIDLKKRAVLGNLVVSLLTALPVFLVAIFDVLPAATPENAAIIRPVLYVIIAYSAFAFYTNFIREIIKDAEDLEGDREQNYRNLAIILGRKAVRYILFTLILILLIFTAFFNFYLFESDLISSVYLLVFVNIPILYLLIRIYYAKTKQHFKYTSVLLKLIMLTGIVSMVVFTLSLKIQF